MKYVYKKGEVLKQVQDDGFDYHYTEFISAFNHLMFYNGSLNRHAELVSASNFLRRDH